MQIDLELALTDPACILLEEIQAQLPAEFYAEDRSNRDWGLVIRATRAIPVDVGDAIELFLVPLRPISNIIRQAGAVLRVGVFYDTVTCTLQIRSCKDLGEMGISLEISVYPSSDEDAD